MSEITIKNQCFGLEDEMTGITREEAATALAEHFGTQARYEGGGYGKWTVKDQEGKTWTLMSDSSIRTEKRVNGRRIRVDDSAYQVEMVTPKLTYEEIPKLQDVIRALWNAGARVNDSCGLHMEAIEAGLRPVLIARRPYVPYKKHPKYTGFMALYVHYLYLLGKIKKREYPPKMTPHLKAEIMKFEKYKAQFRFLHENHITGPEQLAAHKVASEERLAALTKHRTILNAQKKKRKPLYDAIADAEAFRPAMDLYAEGMTGMEDEAARYMDAVDILEEAGASIEQLKNEKAAAYEAVAEVNRDIRAVRKQIAMCDEITKNIPQIEKDVHSVERTKTKEVNRDVREF